MDQDNDFSSLRNLLALKRLDMPKDTQIEEFLVELHRRQRAQLLVPRSRWARAMGWIEEHVTSLELAPTLSYASAFAVVAIVACVGFSQQVHVTQVDGQSRLTFQMPAHNSSFAMLPGLFGSAASAASKPGDALNFTPVRTDSTTTRYVLANNSHGAYDATVAF